MTSGTGPSAPRVLAPVLRLAARMGTMARLGVLVVLLLVPAVLATTSYARVIGGQVAFTSAERDGVAVLRPALDALAATVAGRPAEIAAVVDAAQAHPRLGVGDEARALAERLGAGADSPAARAEAAQAIAGFVTEVGNRSNLILDPDLDSFYVMDVLVVQVPRALVAAASVAAPAQGAAADQVAARAVRAGELSSAGSALTSDIETAAGNTAATGLAGRLQPMVEAADAATQLAAVLTASLADRAAGGSQRFDVSPLASALARAVPVACDELDSLLHVRQARLAGDRALTLALTLAAVTVAVWFAIGVIWRTRADVGLVLAGVNSIAEGRTHAFVVPDGRDELGRIGSALDATRRELERRDAELQRAVAGREQQLQANLEQERSSQDQIQERARSIIDATATDVVHDLSQVGRHVGSAREAAGTIETRVRAADEVTRSVVAQAGEAVEVVGALGGSLRQVAGMAKLIAGVADQTKLLALNATIEAARAGEAGRGFSVVANEVKQLAMTTATSTEEITTTIASLERDAEAMAEVIGRMSQQVSGLDETTQVLAHVADEQFGLVDRLGGTLAEAIERVRGMSQMTGQFEQAGQAGA